MKLLVYSEMDTRKVMTVQELQEIIETDWGEIADVIVLPTISVDDLSDEEFLVQQESALQRVAGTFEVITNNDDYGQLAIGADMTFEEVDVDLFHEEVENEPSTSTQANHCRLLAIRNAKCVLFRATNIRICHS